MTQEKMKVTLNLSSITVEVSADPTNNKDILEKAKAAALEQLAIQFPKLSYSVASVDALTMDTVQIGQTVGVSVKNEIVTGIVSGKNTKTINVTLSGSRMLQGSPANFTHKEVTDPETVVWGQKIDSTIWVEGDTGFLNNGGTKIPVIIGKLRGKKTKAYIINGGGRHFTLEESQLKLLSATK